MPIADALELYADSVGAYVFVFIFGAMWGSFANVCIYRMPPTDEHPEGRSVVTPGSHCTQCDKPIAWYDNIPVFSFFLLRGKCRHCKATFSARYLLVEIATALLFVAAYHFFVNQSFALEPIQLRLLRFAVHAAFLLLLVIIAFMDLDTGLILDKITYPAIPLLYAATFLFPEMEWWEGLVGAAVGYGLIRGVSDGYYLLTKRRGLGYGDGKLLAMVGALSGYEAVVVTLFLGSLLGTIISIPLIALKGRPAAVNEDTAEDASMRHVAVPFGPFLALGAAAYVFVAPWLMVRLSLLWGL